MSSVSPLSYAEALKSTAVKQELHREVRAVIRDSDRRGRNIIISGLEPQQNCKDEELVTNLFEGHMPMKPLVADGCCRRIGKPVQGVPLKLRVTLDCNETVLSILKTAKSLRSSSDDKISSSVFINKDLSPEESKAAYDERVRKRAARLPQSGSVQPGSVSTAVTVTASLPAVSSQQQSSSTATSSSSSPSASLPSSSTNTASISN
jgi:hypothetical protein